LPSRTAPGSLGGSESIKELIRSRPSILEEGFRVLDVNLKTGHSGVVDAVGVDRGGGLSIVVLDAGDPDVALVRLLDAQIWSSDQRDLLGRLYAGHGLNLDRPVRGLLLAPSFTHAFLRRLSLLTPDITALLAREVVVEDGPRLVIEPAASLFGMARTGRSVLGRNGSELLSPTEHRPFWPDGVLPAEDRGAADAPSVALESGEEPVWPGSPDEVPPWDRAGDPAGAVLEPPSDAVAPAPAFESLTTDELEEFDRFERQRRERGRRST